MLINLPKKVICTSIARELVNYFLINDPNLGKPVALMCVDNVDLINGNVNTKYYAIDVTERLCEYFTASPDGISSYIPREVVNAFYTCDDTVNPGMITKYATLIDEIYKYTESHQYTAGRFNPPMRVVDNEGKPIPDPNDGHFTEGEQMVIKDVIDKKSEDTGININDLFENKEEE